MPTVEPSLSADRQPSLTVNQKRRALLTQGAAAVVGVGMIGGSVTAQTTSAAPN